MKGMKEATLEDVLKLRKEIRLNSLYLDDYENSLGFDRYEVCTFFEGYNDFISEEYFEESGNDDYNKRYWEEIIKYDNDDMLERWYYCVEY